MFNTIIDTIAVFYKLIKILIQCKIGFFSNRNKKIESKTAFIIASHLPPNSNGGVFRPLSFIQNAKKHGWTCKGFSFDYDLENPDAGSYLLNKLNDQSCLERVQQSTFKPSWKLVPRIDGGFVNCLVMFEYIIKKKFNRPDVILVSGPRFNTFLTGYFLSKFYHTHLVLDYRDEWSLCPFSWVTKESYDHFLENLACKQASKIIFTTRSHLNNHALTFHTINKDKRIVIANGYDQDDLDVITGSLQETPENDRFILSFIGALTDHSLPNLFLEDLEKIFLSYPELSERICVNFIGNKSEKAKNILLKFNYQSSIRILGHVSKAKALDLMINSDCLLILAGEGMKTYIPGKLFDYLSVKRPILYYGETGETSAIINELNAGFTVEMRNHNELKCALLALLNKDYAVNSTAISEWIKYYSRDNLSEILYRELDSLIKQN